MEFSFFTTDNKSGYKTSEKWLSNNHKEELDNINSYCNQFNIDFTFKEKIWFYYNKLSERPKCKTCGKELKFTNRFDRGYGNFCSVICINNNREEMISRQKKTFNEKYGVDFYPQHKDFVAKQKATKLKKYGNENYNNLNKSVETKIKKYGIDDYINHKKYKETCLLKYGVNNFSKTKCFNEKIFENFKKTYHNYNIITKENENVTIHCDRCNNDFEIKTYILHSRSKSNSEICTICNPIGQSSRSSIEKNICNFLDENSIKYEPSYKILKNKQEIDIFIPDFNFGIEVDGLYWHNELFVEDNYHLNKTKQCKELGIDLIHIFEDEYKYKFDIVKSILKYKLNLISSTIFGRKCEIKEIKQKECREFLNANHIQGNVNSKVRIGLFHNNELVSVMTFSKGRIIMGGKQDEWELSRFCNKINHKVVGAADKLFKYFIKTYIPVKIISYSDKRLFNGNMYRQLGFAEKNHSKPNYWYIINDLRYHRFNFRKSILVKEGYDKNMTEHEIMFERKIYRIYDCGNIRWEYTLQ